MNLPAHHAEKIRQLLAEHRQLAQLAELAPDLDTAKRHLNAAWSVRVAAVTAINDAERETREAALRQHRSAA
jgi:hypothetical protein